MIECSYNAQNERRGARSEAVQGAEPCRTLPVWGGEGGSPRHTAAPGGASASSCRSPLLIALKVTGSTKLSGNLMRLAPFSINHLAIDTYWHPINHTH